MDMVHFDFWARKNASDDNEFGIGIRPTGKKNSVNTWRYITLKAGKNRDRVRNSGQFSILEDLIIFPGQTVKIWDCPSKIGMDGHLIINEKQNNAFQFSQQKQVNIHTYACVLVCYNRV